MLKMDLVNTPIEAIDNKPLSKKEINDYLNEFEHWHFFQGYLVRCISSLDYEETCLVVKMVMKISYDEKYYPEVCFDKQNCFISLKPKEYEAITEKDIAFVAKVDNSYLQFEEIGEFEAVFS